MNWQKVIRSLGVLMLCCVLLLTAAAPAMAYTNHTRDEAMDWVRSQVGRAIDMDGAYGAQCVDFIAAYYDYLGVRCPWGNGADFAHNALPEGWQRIPDADPEPGDILVYTGGYGHVGIYESDYATYHQNVNGRRYVQKITFHYTRFDEHYWGVIRPDFKLPPANLEFQDPSARVYHNNAAISIRVRADRPGRFSACGFEVFGPDGSTVAKKDLDMSNRASVLDMEFNIYDDAGVLLEPGIRYRYGFYTVFDGVTFESPLMEFTTQVPVVGPTPFWDVPEGAFYCTPVLWAVENKIAAGVTDVKFSPGANCDRAMIVSYLWRAAGRPAPKIQHTPFVDLDPDAYYYDAVLWALENNIASGTDATHFSPKDACSRAQMVSFLWRANNRPVPTTAGTVFEDIEPDSYYTNAVLWAVENGIAFGVNDSHFAPFNSCTRGQAVSFLYRSHNPQTEPAA